MTQARAPSRTPANRSRQLFADLLRRGFFATGRLRFCPRSDFAACRAILLRGIVLTAVFRVVAVVEGFFAAEFFLRTGRFGDPLDSVGLPPSGFFGAGFFRALDRERRRFIAEAPREAQDRFA